MNLSTFSRRMWIIFVIFGILFALFSMYNFLYIPAIDPADPDMGWSWLSTDPEVIEYIKFNFKLYGLWILSGSIFLVGLAATGYRTGARLAWFVMWYAPIHLGLYVSFAPWLVPMLLPLIVAAITAQIIAYRNFFPAAKHPAGT